MLQVVATEIVESDLGGGCSRKVIHTRTNISCESQRLSALMEITWKSRHIHLDVMIRA